MNLRYSLKSQNGAALIVSLLMLTVMTLLGVTAMQSNLLQEKMAGNFRDANTAFQAAEAALRDGENWLMTQTSEPIPETSNSSTPSSGVFDKDTLGTQWWKIPSVWNTNALAFTGFSGIKSSPKRVVELQQFLDDGSLTIGQRQRPKGRMVYRVTSRGTGGTNTSSVTLQSSYAKRF